MRALVFPLIHKAPFCWDSSDLEPKREGMPMIPDTTALQIRLAALPLASCGAGETVLTEGTKTGRLLILKTGAVSIVKDGTR